MTSHAPPVTIVDAEVADTRVDVRLEHGRIAAVGPSLPRHGSSLVRAGGGALLPGLHDHHLHLLAMAARERSLDVAGATGPAAFDLQVRQQHGRLPAGRWLRVVGYDEAHGPLNGRRLDELAPGRAVRVQHRSGAAWLLSSAGAAATGTGTVDGWRHREDEVLARDWQHDGPPDLRAVAARLAAHGVTGVTDATPFTDPGAFATLAAARRAGELPQRVVVTGAPALADHRPPDGLDHGPVKVIVADHRLPDPDRLAELFRVAHRAHRPVAVHCVTRVALVLAIVALEQAGSLPGDRIEHASVVPLELVDRLAALAVQVVTQPAFVHAHGDRYLRTVEPEDLPHLYRCASLLDAGSGVGGSTDAPFGPEDPWLAISTAVDRRTSGGATLGADESVSARTALERFLSRPDEPGGPPRTVRVGEIADLLLLDAPLDHVLAAPEAGRVVATWAHGARIHPAPTHPPPIG